MNTLEKAVSRFLGWKLPKDFNPDCGISFIRESSYEHPEFGRTLYEPIGTNLFTAEQTKRMLEHVCEPLISALRERDAEIEALHAHRHTREDVISDCKCALEHVLDALTTVYGISAETPISREIQEVLK